MTRSALGELSPQWRATAGLAREIVGTYQQVAHRRA